MNEPLPLPCCKIDEELDRPSQRLLDDAADTNLAEARFDDDEDADAGDDAPRAEAKCTAVGAVTAVAAAMAPPSLELSSPELELLQENMNNKKDSSSRFDYQVQFLERAADPGDW